MAQQGGAALASHFGDRVQNRAKTLEICVEIGSMMILLTLVDRFDYNMLTSYQNHS